MSCPNALDSMDEPVSTAVSRGEKPIISRYNIEYIPNALHGMDPKIPCAVSTQKVMELNDFQSSNIDWRGRFDRTGSTIIQ
mmetsp:Transcript_3411/g.7997  ORF Transcript_3411/g.7997 Transcript_3411/m.7997 type:complete len:81 (+) Transcript_3411:839-1081(+)